jgi:hypothetical protein
VVQLKKPKEDGTRCNVWVSEGIPRGCRSTCRMHASIASANPSPTPPRIVPFPTIRPQVWCGSPTGECWSPDIWNHTSGECWLKYQKDWDNSVDRSKSNLAVNLRGRYPPEFRKEHKTAPGGCCAHLACRVRLRVLRGGGRPGRRLSAGAAAPTWPASCGCLWCAAAGGQAGGCNARLSCVGLACCTAPAAEAVAWTAGVIPA